MQETAVALLLGIAMTLTGTDGRSKPDYTQQREQMIRDIQADVRRTTTELGRSSLDPRVLEALRSVPRHEFVPEPLRGAAYENRPLPIGEGQTISQPYIVAIMSELLELPADARVLEVGTGSGYQAAVLGELAAQVYSIEIVEPLGRKAAGVLERLGYDNVHVKIGDGFAGWPEHGPYDGIIVTAAAPEVPPPLLEQLKPGGRMVIPVDRSGWAQDLMVVEKTADGRSTRETILPVMFVPLTR